MTYTSDEKQNWLAYTVRIAKTIAKVRPLAYTSEIGESFRPIIPRNIVNGAYGVSILYVAADIYHNSHDQFILTNDKKKTAIVAGDLTLWHSFASMIFPAVTIHTIVRLTGKGLTLNLFSKLNPKVRQWTPTLIGLSSIPFIIHPLDHITDYLMDLSVRKLYRTEKIAH